jgi:hypothetical protein
MSISIAGVTLTDDFPFSDLDKLEAEEDLLPAIPDWPTIFADEQSRPTSTNTQRNRRR